MMSVYWSSIQRATGRGSMNPEIKEQWCRALESGEYKQVAGALKHVDSNEIRHCCLGVLSELAAEAGVVEWRGKPGNQIAYGVGSSGCSDTCLIPEVIAWAGLRTGPPNPQVYYNPGTDPEVVPGMELNEVHPGDYTLSRLNDIGVSFKTIAKLVREQL